jgi:ribosomal protein S18 acetylase RimI-like enzyme
MVPKKQIRDRMSDFDPLIDVTTPRRGGRKVGLEVRRVKILMKLVFPLSLEVHVRLARESDLQNMEWLGMFSHDRHIIEDSYQRQLRGENLMLLADINGFPAAQAWVDLERKRHQDIGIIWAVRVLPFLQGLGLGTRLINIAESLLANRGIGISELSVEQTNVGAHRLYERLGYTPAGEEDGHWLLQRRLALSSDKTLHAVDVG